MKKLLSNVVVNKTGSIIPRRHPLGVVVVGYDQEIMKPRDYDYRNEHILKMTIGCFFSAGKDDYEFARESAQRNLAAHLYGDIIQEINKAMSALSSHDIAYAQSILGGLRQDIIESLS